MAVGCFPAGICIEDEEQWLEGNTTLRSASGCVQEVWECAVDQHSLWSVCEESMSHIVNWWSKRKGVSSLFDRIWCWMVLKAEEKLEYCSLAIMLEPSLCLYAVSSINSFCNVQSYDTRICKLKRDGLWWLQVIKHFKLPLISMPITVECFHSWESMPLARDLSNRAVCLLSAYIVESRGLVCL